MNLKGKFAYTVSLAGVAVLAVSTAIFAAPQTQSQTSPQSRPMRSEHTQMSDHQFARSAAEGGMAEVRLGHLAEERGQNQTVKDFGRRMVQDHGQADDQLKQAAQQENLSLPQKVTTHDQATYDELSKLNGAAFDRAYARDMVRDHEKDIAAFRHEANDGTDQQLKSFASQTLPTLQEHLKMAKHMEEEVSGQAGNGSGR